MKSSRAHKQVHFLNLLLLFIPLWEMNCFPTTIITFKGNRPTVVLLKGSFMQWNTPLTILSGATEKQGGALQNIVTVSLVQRSAVKYQTLVSITSSPKNHSSLSVSCNRDCPMRTGSYYRWSYKKFCPFQVQGEIRTIIRGINQSLVVSKFLPGWQTKQVRFTFPKICQKKTPS